MSCQYKLCDHWTWDGDGSCWGGLTGNYNNTCSNSSSDGTPVLGGHGCKISSYRIASCDNHTVRGYYSTGWTGDSVVFRGPSGNLRDNALRSVKVTEIPRTKNGKIGGYNTNADCPGAADKYEKSGGEKYRCFYDDSDESKIRQVFDQKNGNNDMSALFTSLKEDFCKLSKNVFKNPGGGQCLEYDTTKALAKEYCSVSNRIAADALCTPTNLGNFYADVAEAYCQTAAGKADAWCSCYNVTNNVCDTDSTAAGCETKRQQFDPLVEATPSGFRHVWSGRAACFGGVCQGAKYIPQNANQNCNAPIQICNQSFSLDNISDSTIEAQCNLTAIQNVAPPGSPPAPPSTPPSAGSTPTGPPPSGSPPSGTPPSGTPPSGGINDYIPRSLNELKTDSKKQMAVGGVGGLFLMCCCLLLLVLMSSGGGGGGAMGPTRFRR